MFSKHLCDLNNLGRGPDTLRPIMPNYFQIGPLVYEVQEDPNDQLCIFFSNQSSIFLQEDFLKFFLLVKYNAMKAGQTVLICRLI